MGVVDLCSLNRQYAASQQGAQAVVEIAPLDIDGQIARGGDATLGVANRAAVQGKGAGAEQLPLTVGEYTLTQIHCATLAADDAYAIVECAGSNLGSAVAEYLPALIIDTHRGVHAGTRHP